MSQHVHKIPPQRVPLYMAAMLNMSDAAEDYPPPSARSLLLISYNQPVASKRPQIFDGTLIAKTVVN